MSPALPVAERAAQLSILIFSFAAYNDTALWNQHRHSQEAEEKSIVGY